MKVDIYEFGRWLKLRNLTKETIRAYITDLKDLHGEELNEDVIKRYILFLAKYKPATRSRKLTALRELLKFAGFRYELPKIKTPENTRQYKIISPEEFEEKIKAQPQKWQLILRLIYYYALRVSEVGYVRIEGDKVVIERRKGRKKQVFPKLDFLEGIEIPKVSRQRIYKKVKKLFGVSPHHLRASRLTLLGKENPTVAVIVAGHSNPKTTMRYIQPLEEDIKKVLTGASSNRQDAGL